MKWYVDKFNELNNKKPIKSVCGDNCAICPRYVASSDDELHDTALFWYKAGWRDHVLSNEEIKCSGCGSRQECTFMILPCQKEKGVHACTDCHEYCCDKIRNLFSKSDEKEAQCRMACESDKEYEMLKKAFYEKRKNLNLEHMVFKGISLTFSTENDSQYEAIGQYWDYFSEIYGKENIHGLGYNWSENIIEYVIGFINKEFKYDIEKIRCAFPLAEYKEIELPVEGWKSYYGELCHISDMYEEIYRDGDLKYEIETFWNDGRCLSKIWRTQKIIRETDYENRTYCNVCKRIGEDARFFR